MQETHAKPYVEIPRVSPISTIAERRLAGSLWSHVPFAAEAYELVLDWGRLLGARRVRADWVTALAVLLCAACGVAAALGHSWWALALLLIGGVLDLLDGAIARATGSPSARGALLDSTADRVADAAPLIGLFYAYRDLGAVALAPAAALLGSFLVSYVHARAEALQLNVKVAFPRRAERIVLVAAALALSPVTLGLEVPAVSVALLLVMAVPALVNATSAVLRVSA